VRPQRGRGSSSARSLAEINGPLADLRLALILVAAGGIVVAVGVGLLVARSALRPVKRLTAAAEHVAETQDLSASIDVGRQDELGRLASSFNAMLQALDASRQQQRQLVADASHELRTPMASIRTNIEVLARQPAMPDADRDQLLDDVVTQLEELGMLVDERRRARARRRCSEPRLVDVPLVTSSTRRPTRPTSCSRSRDHGAQHEPGRYRARAFAARARRRQPAGQCPQVEARPAGRSR